MNILQFESIRTTDIIRFTSVSSAPATNSNIWKCDFNILVSCQEEDSQSYRCSENWNLIHYQEIILSEKPRCPEVFELKNVMSSKLHCRIHVSWHKNTPGS